MGRACQKDHSYDPARCAVCKSYGEQAREVPRRTSTMLPLAEALFCLHRGPATGETAGCGSCAGRVRLKVFACDLHNSCTLGKAAPGHALCKGCHDDARVPAPKKTRIDRDALARLDGRHPGEEARFNCSLIRWQGKLLLAYRTGWAGAEIHVATLSENLVPVEVVTLDLKHPRANVGREDPRLFIHNGSLYVSFIGVESVGPGKIVTSQLYAQLTDSLGVEAIYYPHYPGRSSWEKNWQFFSQRGQLYAVYSISPHRILQIDWDTATLVHESRNPFPWAGGHLRGGASPVWDGEKWVSWFHGAAQHGAWRYYSVGLYAFSPDGKVLAQTPAPLAWADLKSKPSYAWAPVVFPCGAVLEGGRWRVSLGIHDAHCEVWDYDARQVSRLLDSGSLPVPDQKGGDGGRLREEAESQH